MRFRLVPALPVLATSCLGQRTPHSRSVPAENTACASLDEARKELARGRVRSALSRLDRLANFCDAKAAKLFRAELLTDLARYEEAARLVDELIRSGVSEATALGMEIRR